MIRRFFRLVLIGGVVGFFLLLYRPDFVANAGHALLNASNGNVVGSAQLLPNLQGQGSSLQLSLQGLTSNLHYVVTLDEGSCGGKVLATVGSVTADGQGNAIATIEKSDLNAALSQGVWLDVHQGSVSGPRVACGQVQLNSTVAADQSSSGSTPTYATPVAASTSTVKNTTTSSNQFSTTTNTNGVGGFPQTGVAPAKDSSYNNYKFPRKY